jgi:solute carrier family 25 citrate transporter 1
MATAVNSRVTPFEHTLIGAVGGVTEVCLMQPMVAFKNALQEGRPLPRTPVAMYRGLLVRGLLHTYPANLLSS